MKVSFSRDEEEADGGVAGGKWGSCSSAGVSVVGVELQEEGGQGTQHGWWPCRDVWGVACPSCRTATWRTRSLLRFGMIFSMQGARKRTSTCSSASTGMGTAPESRRKELLGVGCQHLRHLLPTAGAGPSRAARLQPAGEWDSPAKAGGHCQQAVSITYTN